MQRARARALPVPFCVIGRINISLSYDFYLLLTAIIQKDHIIGKIVGLMEKSKKVATEIRCSYV